MNTILLILLVVGLVWTFRRLDETLRIATCSDQWKADSRKWRGEVLCGWYSHWCAEWDELPVDWTCSEITCCSCYKSPLFRLLRAYRRFVENRAEARHEKLLVEKLVSDKQADLIRHINTYMSQNWADWWVETQ